MNPAQLRIHIEAYLSLRKSLGFQTEYETYHLRELADYVAAKDFSWPIRTQTILNWIEAASLHCGLPGQKMRLTQARCFLRHLKASVPETEVPGPGLLPHPPRPKPRLYSNEEIAKLSGLHISVRSRSERTREKILPAVLSGLTHCIQCRLPRPIAERSM